MIKPTYTAYIHTYTLYLYVFECIMYVCVSTVYISRSAMLHATLKSIAASQNNPKRLMAPLAHPQAPTHSSPLPPQNAEWKKCLKSPFMSTQLIKKAVPRVPPPSVVSEGHNIANRTAIISLCQSIRQCGMLFSSVLPVTSYVPT